MLKYVSMIALTLITISGCVSTQQQYCEQPRPEVCTFQYDPVCAQTKKKNQRTESNACSACSNPDVVSYTIGECPLP